MTQMTNSASPLDLSIAREGEPFAGDKDIDFQLDAGVDRAAVAAAFAEGFAPIRVPAAHAEATRRWCMGYVHEATGIGIDLFFAQRGVATMRQSLGWPDDLFYEYPRFTAGMLAWRGRDWPVLASLGDGTIVAVEQGSLLGTSFHPEMNGELRFHARLLEKVREFAGR